MSVFLECRGLSKSYKNFTLGPLDLTLDEGWFYALVGPNGAGKTTFLRSLLTLTIPDSGSLKLWGLEPLKHEVEVKQQIGFVLDNQFQGVQASWQSFGKYLSKLYPDWDEELFITLAKRLGFAGTPQIQKFSTGNKAALALACALAHRPRLVVLDEPTSGLDPAARAEVFDLLREFQTQEGRSVIFSTHLLDDVETLADQVIFLAGGQVKETGTPLDLTEKYHLVKTPAAEGNRIDGLLGARTAGAWTTGVVTDPSPWEGRADSLVERPTLDDLFVHLIREGRSRG